METTRPTGDFSVSAIFIFGTATFDFGTATFQIGTDAVFAWQSCGHSPLPPTR